MPFSCLCWWGLGLLLMNYLLRSSPHIICGCSGTALLACKLLFFWSSCCQPRLFILGLAGLFCRLSCLGTGAVLEAEQRCLQATESSGTAAAAGREQGGKQEPHSPQPCHISRVRNPLGSGMHRKEAFARWAGKTNSAFFFEMDLFPVLECKQGGKLMCTQQKRQHLIFMPVSRHCIPWQP